MGTAWIMGFFASAIGTGFGGGFAWMLKGFHKKISTVYALCAGMLMGLLFLEMFPESIDMGGWIPLLFGIIVGWTLFQSFHLLMHKITIVTGNPQKDVFVQTGLLLSLSIAVHNFPIGVAIGAADGSLISKEMMMTLAFHNIPEGIIIFTPLFLAGLRLVTWILCTLSIATPVAIGALIGEFVGRGNQWLLAFMINIALAIILMVTVKEIFKESVKHSSVVYSSLIGTIGFLVIYFYLSLF
ncbi:Zinc transporter ZupT [Peribacillus frigoritolerans]|uniref:ZIP family metal transporter n=1 Tax=Peribacillus frigoritolerans TaxID=450367 RepID=UPI0030D14465